MHSPNHGDDAIQEDNPFDISWLIDSAEKSILHKTDENSDKYWLGELYWVIMRNA